VSQPVRVLLADSQPLLRSGFRAVLAAEPDLDVVGEAGDGAEAVRLARRTQPDLVVIDIRMPRLDGVAAIRAIVDSARVPVRVLALTTGSADSDILRALRAGSDGVLDKDLPATQLTAAVRAVAAGTTVLAPWVLHRLVDAVVLDDTEAPAPAGLGGLTDREREVFVQVARGLTNTEIGVALGVTETTVKTHVGRVLTKLGVRDRVQAVVLAYESGLVSPGSAKPQDQS
jgi:DNA-binding NarL/FixJ family response regulator